MRWNEPVHPSGDVVVPVADLEPEKLENQVLVTLNTKLVVAMREIAETSGYTLDEVFHLAVREFLRKEGVLWHEGLLRVVVSGL